MIRIVLNDDELELTQGPTIQALLEQVSMSDAERIAIAVNDTVIHRGDWPTHQ